MPSDITMEAGPVIGLVGREEIDWFMTGGGC